MALGLERAIAELLSTPPPPLVSFGGLYDDPDPAQRVIFLHERPPRPADVSDPVPAGSYTTTSELAILIVLNPGRAPLLRLGEAHSITVQVYHPSAETALEVQRAIYDRLQEAGGGSNGAHPQAKGLLRGIHVARIVASANAVALGRDRSSGDGRFVTSQTFDVQTKPFAFS